MWEVTCLWSRAKVRELEMAREDRTRSQEAEEEGEKPRPSKAAALKALFAALQDRAWPPMPQGRANLELWSWHPHLLATTPLSLSCGVAVQ